jgi:hypothetical protein
VILLSFDIRPGVHRPPGGLQKALQARRSNALATVNLLQRFEKPC